MDDANVPQSIPVAIYRSNSLEPTELDLELPEPPSDEMDENFLAALQLFAESFDSINPSSTSATEPEEALVSLTNDLTSSQYTDAPAPRPGHRVSKKQQIDNLRGTIEELTEQLESLRSGSSRAGALGRETLPTDPLWQPIAARQLERRREAERDNAKLRAMLDLQVQEAKNLKRVLKRRTRIEMMKDMLGVKRHKMLTKLSTNHDDSIHVLQEMLESTDEIYAGVDNDFANRGMDQVPCPGKTRTANRHATNGAMLEILEKQIVPFKAKMTEKAVSSAIGHLMMQPLQCVKDVNAQVDFYAHSSQHSDDTMMISYTAVATGFQREVRLVRIRKVMRKYVEADRTVFICRMNAQPQLTSLKMGVGHRCVIRVVVEKATLQANRDDTTLIKSYYSVSRHVPVKEEFQASTDVDLAIAVWDEAITRVSGELESFLLDAKISPSTMSK